MSGFSLEIPADPRWLHVARSVVLTAVGVSDTVPSDFEAFALAVGEACLELSTTPGVTTISVTLDPGGSGVELVGRGESIEVDGPSPLLELILGVGARGFTIETGESQYSFTLPMETRQP